MCAAGTAQLRPDDPDHFESCRHKLEKFRYVFTEFAQRAATLRTRRLLRSVHLRLARQVIRQRPPRRFSPWHVGRSRLVMRVVQQRGLCKLGRFQIFKPQFELLNLTVELLALAPELHPPQPQDEQFQIFDFGLVRDERFVLRDQILLLREDQ